jgi:uncharacterized membrane protein
VSRGAGLARLAAAAAVAALPPLAFHALILAQGASALVVALGWLGAAACAVLLARATGAGAARIAVLLALVASAWLATRGTPVGAYVAPIATWLLLLAVFVQTLLPGHEPLVSAIARICHDSPLSPDMARYTRAVTAAWAILFAAAAATLAGLAAVLPLPTWSLIANVGALPLVVAAFAVEYAVRRRRFPDFQHVSPMVMAARLGRAGWSVAAPGK